MTIDEKRLEFSKKFREELPKGEVSTCSFYSCNAETPKYVITSNVIGEYMLYEIGKIKNKKIRTSDNPNFKECEKFLDSEEKKLDSLDDSIFEEKELECVNIIKSANKEKIEESEKAEEPKPDIKEVKNKKKAKK